MVSHLRADCTIPDPPFGHLLPQQGERAQEPLTPRSGFLLPLWEKVDRPKAETDEGSLSQHDARERGA